MYAIRSYYEAQPSEESAAVSEESASYPEEDIVLVMNQANCSREAAIRALKENNGDKINAIISLN